jgi:two-component system chemotaxis response regulator CheB
MKISSLRLVVIGTSAGGYAALDELVTQLNPELNIAYCIVVHLSNNDVRTTLAKRLQRLTKLHCIIAKPELPLKKGTIYIAQPGRHLLIKENKLIIGHGPEENNYRPSINVLFRSAAVSFRNRTIGIILTGLMTDGVAGMESIKLCGGTLIVQDPKDSEFPDLPLATLEKMEVDYTIPLEQMGSTITTVVKNRVKKKSAVPPHILAESKRSEKMAVAIEGMDELGKQSPYSCPDCGGVLWERKEDKHALSSSYRCHTGHVYTETELLLKQAKEAESAIWIAIRIMEERKHLLLKIAGNYKKKKMTEMFKLYERKAADIKTHVDKMKMLLTTIEDSDVANPM